MLNLTRKEVKTFRALGSRAIAKGDRQRPLFVRFIGGLKAQRLQFRTGGVDLDWELPNRGGAADFAIPPEALGLCEGNDDSLIAFNLHDGQVSIEWTDGAVPQRRSYADESKTALAALPEPPALCPFDPATLFPALAEATSCAADEAIRFALTHLQLRGAKGEVAASDAHQLLIRGGLPWPWADSVLVPKSKIYGAKELARGSVAVGRSKDHVVLRRGPWTLWLMIEKELRFAPVDEIMPKLNTARAQVMLNADDAAFLAENLPRLPSPSPEENRVTLHLNGQTIVRAKGENGPATDLVLRNSLAEGKEMLVNMNPRFLARALRLGFSDIRCWTNASAIVAVDGDRRFAWMPLGEEGVFKADPQAVRIESPRACGGRTMPARTVAPVAHGPVAAHVNTNERRTTPMKTASMAAPTAAQTTQPALAASPLQEAEALRSLLRDGLARANVLVHELKRAKRQRHAVRNALALLPQLQEAAA